MAKTATHIGECQGCGHIQKLPGGTLSLHGYTVAWGFFSGTCDGARELPYELSCDYCKKQIVRCTEQREKTLALAAHYRRPITEAVADYVTVSIGRDPRTGRERTVQVKDMALTMVENPKAPGHFDVIGTYERDGETHTVNFTGINGLLHYEHPKTALAAAKLLNERLAKMQDLHAQQLLSYIQWQEKRVTEWKLRELRTVEEEAKTVKAGDSKLLETLAEADEPVEIMVLTARFNRNGKYTQATKLISLGLAEKTEEGDRRGRTWIKVRITEAGRKHLNDVAWGRA